MSEITPSEKEESGGTVLESCECTSDVPCDVLESKTEIKVPALELEELKTELDEATSELASVDVTVENKGSKNESPSSTEVEENEEEEIGERVSLISDGLNDNKSDDESEGSDEEAQDEETVTCALLGLEQAKVS